MLQSDCSEIQEGFNNKFANDNTDIKLLQQGQSQNNKLTWGILIGVVCLTLQTENNALCFGELITKHNLQGEPRLLMMEYIQIKMDIIICQLFMKTLLKSCNNQL